MMGVVNLKELSQRQSIRVEWKDNIADIEDILKTAVAFSNDYSNCNSLKLKDKVFLRLSEP